MSLFRLSIRLYHEERFKYVRGEEVRMTQFVFGLHFLAFRAILKLKLVDPKITHNNSEILLLNWTAVNIMSSKVDDTHVTSCTDKLNNTHITCTKVVVDICANCGKDGGNVLTFLKACTACKLVKYCNRLSNCASIKAQESMQKTSC